jgi:hypothetical protein
MSVGLLHAAEGRQLQRLLLHCLAASRDQGSLHAGHKCHAFLAGYQHVFISTFSMFSNMLCVDTLCIKPVLHAQAHQEA